MISKKNILVFDMLLFVRRNLSHYGIGGSVLLTVLCQVWRLSMECTGTEAAEVHILHVMY